MGLYIEKISKLASNTDTAGDAFRFLIAGSINVLLSLCVYQLCLLVWSHDISYALSWVAGLTYLVVVYPSKVFSGGSTSLLKSLIVLCSYFLVFTVGLWCLSQFVSVGINERLAIFLVLPISTVLNFVCMRIVYRFI